MGCDESVDSLVARAILTLVDMGWVGDPLPADAFRPQGGERKASSSGPRSKARTNASSAREGKVRPVEVPQQASSAPPPSLRPAIAQAIEAKIDARIDAWYRSRNMTAIGNLGEHVALRVLARPDSDYEVIATQADLKGVVATRMNPEDLVAFTHDNRFTTINVKATGSPLQSQLTARGDLSTPDMGKGQNLVQYYSKRAEFLSPLDGGQAFGHVLKVDLIRKQAQMFEIDAEGRLSRVGPVIDVLDDVVAVHRENPTEMKAPAGPNASPSKGG